MGGQATKTKFVSVSAGRYHTCGLRVDGSVACWGRDEYGQATPPEAPGATVEIGATAGVGVVGDVGVQVTKGEFASASAGWDHTCGVRVDGYVACWGFNADGKATPPEGEFASVSAGGGHTCGLRVDGYVACWGSQARN